MIDPSLLTLLGGAGGIGLLVRSALYYFDRERDRRLLYRAYMDSREAKDVEVIARGLRALREVDRPVKPSVRAPRAIEAPKPDAPPGSEPSRAA